jgi:hypothetical protein
MIAEKCKRGPVQDHIVENEPSAVLIRNLNVRRTQSRWKCTAQFRNLDVAVGECAREPRDTVLARTRVGDDE